MAHTQSTTVTIIGEGFKASDRTRLRVGNERVCGPAANETCLATSVVFIDSFTLVVRIPPHPENFVLSRLDAHHATGDHPRRIAVPVALEVALNGQDYTTNGRLFYFQRPWIVDSITPIWAPLYGGTVISVQGRYFRNTREMLCRFGDSLMATDASFVSTMLILCRTPSVKMHGRVSVELSLDAQHWSPRANALIVNDLVQEIVPLSPGLASSPTKPMAIDAADVLVGYAGVYIQYYGVRIPYTCGSNAWSNLGHAATASSLRDNDASGLRHGGNDSAAALTPHHDDTNAHASVLPAAVTRTTSGDSSAHDTLRVSTADPAPCELCALSPVEVEDLAGLDVLSVALGRTFGLAVASETYGDAWRTSPALGRLFSFGDNYVGQLGTNDYSPRAAPWMVKSCCRSTLTPQGTSECTRTMDEERIVAVRAGSFHSMAISELGTLYTWGWNGFGQLGLGILNMNPSVAAPLAVEKLESAGYFVVDASGGYSHSLVLVKPGFIFAMGSNNNGQLGVGDRVSSRVPLQVLAAGPTGEQRRFKQVSAGLYHSLAVTSNGLLFAWGSNANGQLGLCASIPRTAGAQGVCHVSAGAGSGFLDQLSPMQVMELASVRVAAVSAGTRHTVAVSEDGNVYVWGDNKHGQLGVPLALDSAGNAVLYHVTPQLVRHLYTPATACNHPHASVGRPAESEEEMLFSGQDLVRCFSDTEIAKYGAEATAAAAGDGHSLVLVQQRRQLGRPFERMYVPRLYAFGRNDEGQLGLDDTDARRLPHLVLGLRETPGFDIISVDTSFDQSSLTRACPSVSSVPCSAQGLCYRDGTCYCEEGVRGRDCSIECFGSKAHPCSGNGDAAKARLVSRRLQASLSELAGWKLEPTLLAPIHLQADAHQRCGLRAAAPSPLPSEIVCTGPGAADTWGVYPDLASCLSSCAVLSWQQAPLCQTPNAGAECKEDADCSGTHAACVWQRGSSADFSVVRVMEELLSLGGQNEALDAVALWAALGRSTEMGRPISRCHVPLANLTQMENNTEAQRHALIETCAKIFDVDGDRVLSRTEMQGLWRALQQRALDAVLTGREFYMVLQVRVFLSRSIVVVVAVVVVVVVVVAVVVLAVVAAAAVVVVVVVFITFTK